MRCSRVAIQTILLLGGLLIQRSAHAGTCLQAPGWSSDSAASYLTLDRGSQTPECTAAALRRLAEPGVLPDPALLIRYIDFVQPDAGGMIILQMTNVADLYPAVKALEAVGAPALPVLLDFLKRREVEEHLRRNAVRAIKLIAKDDAYAIGYLFAAADAESGIAARARIEQAAKWAFEWCADVNRPACGLVYEAHAHAQ